MELLAIHRAMKSSWSDRRRGGRMHTQSGRPKPCSTRWIESTCRRPTLRRKQLRPDPGVPGSGSGAAWMPGGATAPRGAGGPIRVYRGRFSQPLSGHAAIGLYLAEKTKPTRSSEFLWCGSGHRLFVGC